MLLRFSVLLVARLPLPWAPEAQSAPCLATQSQE